MLYLRKLVKEITSPCSCPCLIQNEETQVQAILLFILTLPLFTILIIEFNVSIDVPSLLRTYSPIYCFLYTIPNYIFRTE